MPGQQNVSGFEQNTALRRGTRNRIAKRRPDFVDPFSLRKKRKLKNEGDELLSALSPCSEEGSLKLDSTHNISVPEGKEKIRTFSKPQRKGFDTERVQSLPTSNPRVKVIIRLSPETDMNSLDKSSSTDSVLKLRLRLRPAVTKSNSQASGSPLPIFSSSSEAGPQRPDTNTIQPPACPQRSFHVNQHTTLKTVKIPSARGYDNIDMNDMNTKKAHFHPIVEEDNASRTSKDCRSGDKRTHNEEDVSYRGNLKIHPASKEASVGHMIHVNHMNSSSSHADLPSKNKSLAFLPKEDSLSSIKAEGKQRVGKATELQKRSAPKLKLMLVSRVSSLPIRKRPYMRVLTASPSPVLRRSTRNKQHPLKPV